MSRINCGQNDTAAKDTDTTITCCGFIKLLVTSHCTLEPPARKVYTTKTSRPSHDLTCNASGQDWQRHLTKDQKSDSTLVGDDTPPVVSSLYAGH